jgi:hypothetical protein
MKLARLFRIVLLTILTLQICSEFNIFKNRVSAAGGNVLWEHQLKVGFHNSPSQILVDGQQVVVAGTSLRPNPTSKFQLDLFVATYDLTTGAGGLVWSATIGNIDPFLAAWHSKG